MSDDQWQTTVSPVQHALPPAGWYHDPALPGHIRYWDGQSWTEHVEAYPTATTADSTPAQVEAAHEAPVESTVHAAAEAVAAAETVAVAEMVPTAPEHPSFNEVFEVRWLGGWPGLFNGENQSRALQRAIAHVNASGRRVAAIATDRWSFFRRLGWTLVAAVTLGFVVRHENLLLVTEPMNDAAQQ